jgi:hypothetical protein
MDLHKILYAKIEGIFQPPSLGFLGLNTMDPNPTQSKILPTKTPDLYTQDSMADLSYVCILK